MTIPFLSAVQRVLGTDFADLPPALRDAHGGRPVSMTGRADVEIFLGVLGRCLCWAMGLPRGGMDQPVTIRFSTDADGVDRWSRDFAGRKYRSTLASGSGRDAGYLVERMGIIATVFALRVEGNRLRFEIERSKLMGIALPRCLSLRCIAYESERDEALAFDIAIDLPWLGRLIAYKGIIRR